MAEAEPGPRFRDVVLLGRGGMGEVFLSATYAVGGFRKLQVVKRLRSEFAENQEFLRMFLDEARLASRLSHPNVVRTHEVGRDDRSYFIVMEYLEGHTLHALLRRARAKEPSGGGPAEPTLDLVEANRVPPGGLSFVQRLYLRAIADTCAGLHYAHDLADHDGTPLEIVHRDVSPGNVFVTYDGTVKVLDFGIAKAANSNVQTQVGVLKGKIPFMAPEVFLKRGRRADRRADVFALGALLWDAAVGERLWKGREDMDIIRAVSRGEIPTPSSLVSGVPPELDALVMRALEPSPDRRFQSALEVQTAIEDLLDAIEPVSDRDIARFVGELFATRRSEERAIIERRLKKIEAAGVAHSARGASALAQSSGALPVPSPGGGGPPSAESAPSLTGSDASLPVASSVGVEAARPRVSLGAVPSAPPSSPGHLGGPVSAPPTRVLPAPRGAPAASTAAPRGAPSAEAAPEPSSRRALLVGLGVAAVALVGVGGAFALRQGGEPAELVLDLAAEPANATLFLDDQALATNPAQVRVTRDGASHRVRAEAPGHRVAQGEIRYDGQTRDVKLVLTKR